MDDSALLAELRALADDAPNLESFTVGSRLHHEWLGKVYALLSQWDETKVPSQAQIELLASPLYRNDAVNKIMRALYRAVADLQFRTQAGPARAFGPGAVYDFFKNLRDLLASATKSILVVDPYLDEEVFDTYLGAVPPQVVARLLTNKGSAALKPAVERFVAQRKMRVEARRSSAIHDRVIFLDDRSCWVLGQSINVAAKSKPTYLAPLDNDTMHVKKDWYEQIWTAAKPI